MYVFYLGGMIFMIGVAQGSYWNHRRIWIQKEDGQGLLSLPIRIKTGSP